jgi:integrase
MDLRTAVSAYLLAIDGIVSPATFVFYKFRLTSLVEFLGDRDLSTITIDDLRAWRKTLTSRTTRYTDDKYHRAKSGPLSPVYIAGFIRAARRLFSWLEQEGRTDRNPARRLEFPPQPKKVRKGCTAADRKAMITAARQSDNPIRDVAILRLFESSACRRAGAALILAADLDLANRRAIIREKGRGGNRKERTIFYSDAAAKALQAWLRIRPAGKDPRLFCLGVTGIYGVFRRLAAAAGIETKWSPHQWRHGAIRSWLNNGMPLSKASQLAGHASIQITGDIYGTSDEAELATARDRYGDD